MEVTVAMGHFCETHGPCVIFCTDRAKEVPEDPPVSLNVPVCKACRSIDLNTIYACQDEDCYYVSTRTSMDNKLASILKDAVLRSLSVEVSSFYISVILIFSNFSACNDWWLF